MLNWILGLWQFLSVWAVGIPIEKRLRLPLPWGCRLAVAFGLGEILISAILLILGLAGGLRTWILLPYSLISLILFAVYLLPVFKQLLPVIGREMKQNPNTGIVVSVLLLIYALGTCVPEREVDSLWYHLGVPQYYIMHGGWIQLVPFNMCCHYPMSFHLHYVISLLLGNDTTAKVFIFCHIFPLLILLASVVKSYGFPQWQLFAAAIYLCNLYIRLPIMANVESAVYFYVFLSTVLLWNSVSSGNTHVFLLASLFCGMAMGSKFSGVLFGYAAQWLLLGGWALFSRQCNGWERVKKWGTHSLISWLMMSPWMIKSYFYTSNPMYPMLGEIFPTRPEFVAAMESNAHNHGVNFLKAHTFHDFLREVVKNLEWLLYNDDLIFYLGIFSLLLIGLTRYRQLSLPLASGSIAYLLFTTQWGSDIGRLFAANYGMIVFCITVALGILTENLVKRGKPAYGFYGLVLLSLFFTFLQQRFLYLCSPNIQWFGGIYLSEPARREWLSTRHIFSREMFSMRDWIQQNIPVEEELYGYKVGHPFYLNRKYIVCDAHFKEQLDQWLKQDIDYAAQQLAQLHVRWLLANHDNIANLPDDVLSQWNRFKDKYLKEVHKESEITLYQFDFSKL